VRLDRTLSQKRLQEIPLAAAEASRFLDAPDRAFAFDLEETIAKLVG
jgi:hypothetical protein